MSGDHEMTSATTTGDASGPGPTGALARLLDGGPGDPMVYLDGVATSRDELRATATELGAALRSAGLSGRAVGVCLPNAPDAIAAWFAVWEAEGTFVPLNPRVPPAELVAVAETTGIEAVVTRPEAVASFAGAPVTARVDVGPVTVLRLDAASPRAVEPAQAIVQFTSGTTGRPKAVVLRHDTVSELLDGVIGSLRGGRSGTPARMPNIVPVSLSLWAGIYQVLFAFTLGVPVVLMHRFEPQEFARLCREFGIRSSVLPPAALVMLLHEPDLESLEPLRYIRSVSAPLSPAHARRFHDRFGIAILNGYGQTELGGEAVGWTADDWKRYGTEKLGSVGRPHPAFELRVRLDDGSLATKGETGELEIKSSQALPPEDAAMEGRITDDGWLRTGDLARIDGDGFVWIEGRVSAMINRGGLKVFPDEVEERMRTLPAVLDVAVSGVPDERLGEVPWAFVVAAPGADVDPDAVRAACRELMAPYKVPAGVTVVDELPRNEIGKVLRQELVAAFERAPGPPPAGSA
jgi:acyl-CoA synthetase (AMP-forming)/AMP-acid ligase II